MKYLIVYEKSDTGWGAYAPDLPGLGVAGKTLDEVKELIREAIEFHLEGMRAHGDRAHTKFDGRMHHYLTCDARVFKPPNLGPAQPPYTKTFL